MDTIDLSPNPAECSAQPSRSATQAAGAAAGALRRAARRDGDKSKTSNKGIEAITEENRNNKGMDLDKIAAGVKLILEGIGEDPEREGLRSTPQRVARMYGELLYGLHEDPRAEISCTFTAESGIVLVRDISFSAMCEHHMVPFIGVAHVGYIPHDGKITGLSKLARVVELLSRRLQVQERMTSQIADTIVDKLQPDGVIVVLEAEHLCMSIRGIRKPGSKTITSANRGCFKDPATRAEAMALIQGRHA